MLCQLFCRCGMASLDSGQRMLKHENTQNVLSRYKNRPYICWLRNASEDVLSDRLLALRDIATRSVSSYRIPDYPYKEATC